MNILEMLKQKPLLMDGAMGTMLQQAGLDAGEYPEDFNFSNPAAVKKVYKSYLRAGSDIILTNTFGANSLHFDLGKPGKLIRAGIRIAREAIREYGNGKERYVGLDIGPTGEMLAPYGELSFEEAVEIFSEMVRAGTGADFILIETMSDLLETKAALLAAKENCSLPVFVSNAYQAGGKLMTGSGPKEMIAMLEGMGADAVGVNCSLGPEQLAPVVEEYLKYASVPVLVKPNAGLPRNEEGRVVYDIDKETFAGITAGFAEKGAALVGGCCGTTPEYIKLLAGRMSQITPAVPARETKTWISSHVRSVALEEIDCSAIPVLACYNIEALVDNACHMEEETPVIGIDTTGVKENEKEFLCEAVAELQAAIGNPLMFCAESPAALEAALRIYKGRPLVNTDTITASGREAASKAAKKYGAVIVSGL